MAGVKTYLRNWFRKERVESELDDELRSFVEQKTDENIASGMAPSEARRAALVECGGVEQVKESVREVRAGALLEQFFQDVRFGLRMLRKSPGFALVAVLTIALGIGVNASIFAIFSSVALRPLQMPDSNRLVNVYQTFQGIDRNVQGGVNLFSYPEYVEYRDRNQVFSGIAAYMPQVGVTLGEGESSTVGQLATCNYFDVMGSKPVLGRGFMESECAAEDSGRVVVLNHDFWVNNFNSDPGVLGKLIRLNRVALTIVGVAAPDFRGADLIPAAFWTPITNDSALVHTGGLPSNRRTADNLSWLAVVGRLKDGVTLAQARANLGVIAAGIDRRTPKRSTQLTVDTATFFGRPDMHRVVLGVGGVVLTAVGLVLLIACANLANLMLARAAGRTREVAVRLAVGASRSRIVRQLLTESLLLALIGGAVGYAVSVWSEGALVRTLAAQTPPTGGQPIALNTSPDFRVFLYALALTVITGIVFGLAPALQASRRDVNRTLKLEGADPEPSGRQGWMRGALVGVQVAVCMVLLVSAGLLLRGLYHAQTIDPGYSIDHIAVVSYDLQREGYTQAQAASFNHDLAERLASLPDVEGVVPAFSAPLGNRHFIGQLTKPGESRHYQVHFNMVGPHLFSSIDIPLVRGRDFSEAEVSSGAGLLIVSEAVARQIWPGEDPVGKRLHSRLEHENDFEVIGVAKDVQMSTLGEAHTPYVYSTAGPAQQLMVSSMIVRTKGEERAALPELRAAAHSVDPILKVDVAPLRDNLNTYIGPSRMVVALAGSIGGLGLLLAAIGIYGTVSYSVARRVREIGIRMTLGARPNDVLSVILRGAMRPVAVGAVAGLVLCTGVSRVLSALLFGVSPVDVVAYTSVAAFLLGVALLASYLPARKALRIDPMSAIRHE